MIIDFIRWEHIFTYHPIYQFHSIRGAITLYIDENLDNFSDDKAVGSAIETYRVKKNNRNQQNQLVTCYQQNQHPMAVEPTHALNSKTDEFTDTPQHSSTSLGTVDALPPYVSNSPEKLNTQTPPQHDYGTDMKISISTTDGAIPVANTNAPPMYNTAHEAVHAIIHLTYK